MSTWRFYRSKKRIEIGDLCILRYELENKVKKNNPTLTVTVSVTHFQKYKIEKPTLLHGKMIVIVKNLKWR